MSHVEPWAPDPEDLRLFANPLFIADDCDAVIASLPHATLIGDGRGIVRANAAALRLLGLDAMPDGGVSFDELATHSRLTHTSGGQHLTRSEQPFAQALLGRLSACDATLDLSASDRRLALRCIAAPIRRGGRQVGVITVYNDVSDLRRTTEVLTRANQELREFAAIVAHDLHEPLRMIRSFLDLAAMRESVHGDAHAARFMSIASCSAQRMQKLIDDLLELGRVGQQHVRRTQVDATCAVREALENLSLALRERQSEVVVGELPVVYADRSQLVRLFQNLIGNAVKYCRPDCPPRIRVEAERRPRDTVFTIHDNGIGIPLEHRQRIFAPFDRLCEKNDAPGTGLGLTICRRIVSRHRGDIWVESAEGQGSAFKFTIPHQEEDGALEPRSGHSVA